MIGGIAIWHLYNEKETVTATTDNSHTEVKYVFYFIADGMGQGCIEAAQKYYCDVLKQEDSLLMLQFPHRAMVTTNSATDSITDSAAAGTALATGQKANRDAVGVSHDNQKPMSIAQSLKNAGWGVGIVTSVCPDDATPASFYAHQKSRFNYFEIGKELAASQFDFIAGSKLRALEEQRTATKLLSELCENNIEVVYGFDALKKSNASKILLLNKNSDKQNIGFTIDSIDNALNLPQITQACIDHLNKVSPEKFFMMVEGGNIDYAGHINDAGAMVKEVINFNQAIKVAYDFYLAHPDETLIVVTADHDTGGLRRNKEGNIANIDFQRFSKEMMGDSCKMILRKSTAYEWTDMKNLLSEKLGFWNNIPINESQEKRLYDKFYDIFKLRKASVRKSRYNTVDDFTAETFDLFNSLAGFSWASDEHTAGKVPVYAIGVGADKFEKIYDNTHIYQELNIITR